MTRRELEARLSAAGIEDFRAEANILFCHFSGLSLAAAMADREADCTDPALAAALARREVREPLAYILGEAYFYGKRFAVSPACLIPRQETELLVDRACQILPHGAVFADFCTGSGCIAVALALSRPDLWADAFDLSRDALTVAKANAATHGVAERVFFYERDLLDAGAPFPRTRYDAILSNPPYLTARDMKEAQPEITSEPRMALFGGEDGMTFYRYFLSHYRNLLAPGGVFLFEIGAAEGEQIRAAAESLGYDCTVTPDYAGLDRVAEVRV
ncbi:MAG: peptide chain release factor N(5)-glutamine methyltransferase [Clostridia bacterium]|nr:peptide chain release factor N(5)-glutamine methyltransferase [Clostridia bacterium]